MSRAIMCLSHKKEIMVITLGIDIPLNAYHLLFKFNRSEAWYHALQKLRFNASVIHQSSVEHINSNS